MARMAPETPQRRPRRSFDDDFKAQAIRLVLDEGKSVGAVARDLDLTESALRQWVERARADRSGGRTGLTTAEREELAKLRKENRELRMERDILKSRGLLREAPSVRFAWIATEKATSPLSALCRVLRVTRGGFYAWQRRPAPPHARRDAELDVHIRALFTRARQRYGSPRIHEDLREAGHRVSRKRVVRLMRTAGLRARLRKRYRGTTMSEHDQPVAPNHLAQAFVADAPISGGSATRWSSSSPTTASCISPRSSTCTRASSWAGP